MRRFEPARRLQTFLLISRRFGDSDRTVPHPLMYATCRLTKLAGVGTVAFPHCASRRLAIVIAGDEASVAIFACVASRLSLAQLSDPPFLLLRFPTSRQRFRLQETMKDFLSQLDK